MSASLTERYRDHLAGVLSCYDRILISGTIPEACYAEGMTRFLNARGIRIFDYPKFALELRDQVRMRAEQLAAASGVSIQHVGKAHVRKEDIIAERVKQRGDHPGLVHILSAMESCRCYQPWHDKRTHRTFVRPDTGKCLHYYFYFIDEVLGLIHLRVPTWCPFPIQAYCNGHSWLARRLSAAGIAYTLADNALVRVDDMARAQTLADTLAPADLHRVLDRYAELCCPVLGVFDQRYHWSLMQVEYATDLIFRSPATLSALYEPLLRRAILAVKAEHVASFLGKKITPTLAQEIGSRFTTRIEGTCLKHRLGKAAVKVYDKFAVVLRLETTTNDVTFFKLYRKVEHHKAPATQQWAAVKKTIYSLRDLNSILLDCNRRYLEYLSALDDISPGLKTLNRLNEPKQLPDRKIKGFNFFDRNEQALLRAIQRPEFNIAGLRRADLLRLLPHFSPSAISRQLRRLRHFRLLKRASQTYHYYPTRLGRRVIAAACQLADLFLIPTLAAQL